MVSFEMDDRKKIGLGLTGFGIFFSFLGVLFFFDKGLLAMGNILFLSGVMLTIGLKSSLQFFMKPSNYKGTISFGVGFFFVVVGWPVLGMILEAYGFIVLFREQCVIVPHKSEEQVLQGAERRQQTVFKRRKGKGQGVGFGKIIKGVLSL
ncbi:vesicle transport protein GOT1-like isoform X1 [Rhododendron vialii]|uniref:vesicle transport protein GOT1-like isoform X1 n=1 Tax=Rhododendron vialii TaxID=182163 RepID=UPI00265DFCF9|nr:vesicle transport protein GOT1-like isoform X1 [Rhododendron vialii]XP_058213540.1 vesicle transport protein GOT1-like isoform X1 [Rhododendron vialii]XP_058213541.1 vesicle transport protein GOT1-like isoform X1 [Rhododendron vialii]